MILFRYLAKQILTVTSAITLMLLVVALISRFILYLGDALAGKLASDILLLLMLFRLPEFLMIILPIALFLSIIVVYARMYVANEMIVLLSSGMSQRKLMAMTLGVASFVLAIVATLTLYLAPEGLRVTEEIKQTQQQLTEVDLIVPGQFQRFDAGSRTAYADRVTDLPGQGRQLENVFAALTNRSDPDAPPRIIFAESAHAVTDAESGARFMQLQNVYQYDGVPGTTDFTIAQMNSESIRLPEPTAFETVEDEYALSTPALLQSQDLVHQAELQWRFSLILMIPILTLLAVPLSKTSPRKGEYGMLLPAILVFIGYFLLLQFSKNMLIDGVLSPALGLWWVHGLFVLLAWMLARGLIPVLSRN